MKFRLRGSTAWWLALMGVALPVAAKSPSQDVKSLTAKKAATVSQRKQVESKLREVKREQRQVSADFHASSARLHTAEAELRRTRTRLQVTEQRIRDTQARLERVNAELEQQTEALWQRLEVFYKQGSVGYLEVVLGATDFDQFVDRAVLYRSIAEDDLRLKQTIEHTKRQQEALQEELSQRWVELQSLKDQCDEKAERIRVETSRKHEALAAVKRDRVQQETLYRELLDTQREIERVLWRLTRSSSSGPVRKLSGGFIMPCNGRFTSSFGMRIHPILGTRRFHDGQDIAAPHGSTIRAAAAGTVVQAGWMKAYGQTVMISHGSGYTTLYGHCSAVLVSPGQQVSQGQPVARVGSTGWSTGPHLHFSVYINGKAVNPMSLGR